MANAFYDKGKEGFLTGSISWTNDTIKAVLVDTGQYTVNLSGNTNLSDIPSAARVATSPALTSKTAVGGVAKAASTTLPAVSGATAEAVVLFKDTGSASTSRLICYIDTNPGLPIVPNGGDVNLHWGTGANGIFRL